MPYTAVTFLKFIGKFIGATLDRNGLRPCRYQVTTDGLVILASEAGVLPMDARKIRQKVRLMPGRMFLVDTVQGRIIDDEEVKASWLRPRRRRSWIDSRVSASRPAVGNRNGRSANPLNWYRPGIGTGASPNRDRRPITWPP